MNIKEKLPQYVSSKRKRSQDVKKIISSKDTSVSGYLNRLIFLSAADSKTLVIILKRFQCDRAIICGGI